MTPTKYGHFLSTVVIDNINIENINILIMCIYNRMDSCCICLCPLHDDIQICVCSCKHYLHATCYRKFLDARFTSCPICRSQLLHRYDSESDDDDEDDEEEYEIEEPVDGESQDDHDNRMLNYWYPACDRLVAKHPYLVLFDPILPHDTTRCLHFRYGQVMA
jgi:hypothetical protein